MDISKIVENFSSGGVNEGRLTILKRVRRKAGEGITISAAINYPFVKSFLITNNIPEKDFNDAKNWWDNLTDEEKNQYE